jgi:hypothetical protein
MLQSDAYAVVPVVPVVPVAPIALMQSMTPCASALRVCAVLVATFGFDAVASGRGRTDRQANERDRGREPAQSHPPLEADHGRLPRPDRRSGRTVLDNPYNHCANGST